MISRKVRKLTQKYEKASGGDFSLIRLDGNDFKFELFAAEVQTMPLFATTRLVIVENIFKAKKEDLDKVREFLPHIPETTNVVFVEKNNPDKRLGLFKELQKLKFHQEFKAVDKFELPRFITREVADRGGQIAPDATQLMAELVGDNIWQISNEIDKLIAYRDGGKIEKEDVILLVSSNIESNVFLLIEHMAGNRRAKAIEELENLYSTGEPALKILAMVNYQYRTIGIIKEALEESQNPFQISKIAGLSYFAVKNSLSFAQKMSWEELAQAYDKIYTFDNRAKTGKIEPEEGLKDLVLNI